MNRSCSTLRRISRAGIVAACLLGATQVAPAREPIDLIPADSLLCWYGRPLPDTAPGLDQPSTLQTLLEVGTRIAGQQLDSGAQLGVRIAEMLSLVIRYPHALALIDARAKPLDSDPQGRRVDRLRLALVVQTPTPKPGANHGQTEPFLRIIQKAVNEQTNSETATLATRPAGRWSYQELTDRRLPAWSVIAWGRIDDHFVLAVGEDVWADVAAVAAGKAPSISQDRWYAAARSQCKQEALIEIFVAAQEIQRRLDPFVDGRAGAFFAAWEADQLEQAHWALGFKGRALFCRAHFRFGQQTVRRLYADPDIRNPDLLRTIPPQARYAIYRIRVDRFLRRLFTGLVCIQDAKARANIERIWARIQTEHGFDVQRDLLAHLGRHVVLHNDPPHPLRLPLAMTTLIEIRDEPQTVRQTIETICAAWRDAIDEAAERADKPASFTLRRDEDGLWYLQLGPLAGLAWTTTDRFIISSWSPRALRTYLAKAGDNVGRRVP